MKVFNIFCLFALMVSTVFAAQMEHDELIQFMLGYLQELHFTEDTSKYLKCVDDKLIPLWRAFEPMKDVHFDDDSKVLYYFAELVHPAIVTVGEMSPCGEQEIKNVGEAISKLVSNEEAFGRKIRGNIDIIKQSIEEIQVQLKANNYHSVGIDMGALIYFMFLH